MKDLGKESKSKSQHMGADIYFLFCYVTLDKLFWT